MIVTVKLLQEYTIVTNRILRTFQARSIRRQTSSFEGELPLVIAFILQRMSPFSQGKNIGNAFLIRVHRFPIFVSSLYFRLILLEFCPNVDLP